MNRTHSFECPPNYRQNPYIGGMAEQRDTSDSITEHHDQRSGLVESIGKTVKQGLEALRKGEEAIWKWIEKKD
jgi:hypothetical protein